MRTVTVLGQAEDGTGKPSALTFVGDSAFGDASHNAFAETTTIQDALNPGIEYTGEVGSLFQLPAEVVGRDLFRNGETCYTGNISPMTYVKSQEPSCEEEGFDEYKVTVPDATTEGKEITLTYHHMRPALGHDWGVATKVKPSCTQNGYWIQPCERKGCDKKAYLTIGGSDTLYDETTNKPLTSEQNEEKRKELEEKKGHQWTAQAEAPLQMQDGTTTNLTYKCESEFHNTDRDGAQSYTIPLEGHTIAAKTTDTLNSIADKLINFSTYGTVRWADTNSAPDTIFGSEGATGFYNAEFVPQVNSPGGDVSEFPIFSKNPDGTKLQVKVEVTKDILDLSEVIITPHTVSVENPATVSYSGLPEDATEPKIEYLVEGKWTEEQPTDEVRVSFAYTTAMYRLPTEEDTGYYPIGYSVGESGGRAWGSARIFDCKKRNCCHGIENSQFDIRRKP